MSDRKYRQRGYMDDGDREARRSPKQKPAERREGPRGRGLGAPTESVFRCAKCGQKHSGLETVNFQSICPHCSSDLHTCTNCSHFDSSSPNECRQPISAPVMKKAKRNECELFSPKIAQEFARGGTSSDPRAAFEALFKK